MNAVEILIDQLRSRDLVDETVLSKLRQVAKKLPDADTGRLIKWLVEQGLLTKTQADKLAAALPKSKSPSAEDAAPPQARSGREPPAAKSADLKLIPTDEEREDEPDEIAPLEEDQLTLQPLEGDSSSSPDPEAPTRQLLDNRDLNPEQAVPPKQRKIGARGRAWSQASKKGGGSATPPRGRSGARWDQEVVEPTLEPIEEDPGLAAAEGDTRKRRTLQEKSVWDSALLRWGGGGLLLMIIAGVVLYLVLSRKGGDESFELAETDYKAGSYAQAIHKFGEYLERYPSHKDAGKARVFLALAKIRKSVEESSDWAKTLRESSELIEGITAEKEFSESSKELADLLPRISENLAAEAQKRLDSSYVTMCEESIAMVDKYVPKSLRPGQQITNVTDTLAVTKRLIDRDTKLHAAIDAIVAAAQSKSTASAYAARRDVIKLYPDTAGSPELRDAILKVAAVEKENVTWTAANKPAETMDLEQPASSRRYPVALTPGLPGKVDGVKGYLIPVLGQGTLFAVEASSGQVRWTRFVGMDTDFVPVAVSREATADWIIVDAVRQEIQRIDVQTGVAKWRQAVGEPVRIHPTVSEQKIVVSVPSGRVLILDTADGTLKGEFKLPLPLASAASLAGRAQSTIVQAGQHSNVFLLNEDGTCQEVIYLGHEPQTVVVRPVAVNRYIFLAENVGAVDSAIRVLLADENLANYQLVQSVAYSGHVLSDMQLLSGSLLVATNRGALGMMQIRVPGEGEPLVKLAAKAADEAAPMMRYTIAKESQAWLSGNDLSLFEMQTSRGQFAPRWTKDVNEPVTQPPLVIGGYVFSVRRKKDQSGYFASALSATSGEKQWEVHLGSTPASGISVNETSGIRYLTNGGGLIEVPASALSSDGTSESVEPIAQAGQTFVPFNAGLAELSTGDGACLGGEGSLFVFSRSGNPRVASITPPDRLANTPIGYLGGILVPSKVGQVFVLDQNTGKDLMGPFSPLLQGKEFFWGPPELVNNQEVLIADGTSVLYQLGVEQQPQAHLVTLHHAEIPHPRGARVGVVGNVAYLPTSNNRLMAFALPSLERGKEFPLGGNVTFGPLRIGERVLLATYNNELICFDEQQNQNWSIPLAYGPPVGFASAEDGSLLMASTYGVISRHALKNGKELGKVTLDRPLLMGPVRLDNRLIVIGYDGSVISTSAP